MRPPQAYSGKDGGRFVDVICTPTCDGACGTGKLCDATGDTPKGARLRSILLNDFRCDNIERSRDGVIHRGHYLRRAQIASPPKFRYIFHQFEAVVGLLRTYEAKLPLVEDWLNARLAEGTLELCCGKVNARDVMAKFGLPKGGLKRQYPRAYELFERFNAKIAEIGYRPRDRELKLEKLAVYLDGSPTLNPDKKSVNLPDAGKATGASIHDLRTPPFKRLLRDYEKRLREMLHTNPFVCIVSGKVYDFRPLLEEGWPSVYVERLARFWEKYFSFKKSPNASFSSCIDIHRFLASGSSPSAAEVRRYITHGTRENTTVAAWAQVRNNYRTGLLTQTVKIGTVNSKIKSANLLAARLAEIGWFPEVDVPMREYSEERTRSALNLVNPGPARTEGEPLDEYVNFALALIREAKLKHSFDLSEEDADDFSDLLRGELSRFSIGDIRNPGHVIYSVICRRIEIIKQLCVSRLRAWHAHFNDGLALKALGVDPASYWDEVTERPFPGVGASSLFTPDRSGRRQAQANLLRLLDEKYDGFIPAQQAGAIKFINAKVSSLGGYPFLQSYLLPHKDIYGATLTLYLLESGANVDVGRTLHVDDFYLPDEGQGKTVGVKGRAGYKAILDEFEASSEVAKALDWLVSHGSRARTSDVPGQLAHLFSMKRKSDCGLMNASWYTNWFKTLVNEAEELNGLRIVPKLLRPTLLLKLALEHGGHLREGMRKAQHSRNITRDYVESSIIRLGYDINIADFQDTLQSEAVADVPDAHLLLKTPKQSLDRRRATGFGTRCQNHKNKPGSGGKPCDTPDCWNGCTNQYFVAVKEDVAKVHMWQLELRASEGEWVRDHPERWEGFWLEWLGQLDVIESKMKNSFPSIWVEGVELAIEAMNSPDYRPPNLWII